MPGPLPNTESRRRNAPTIPTTSLPAGGRKGRAPSVPSWVTLGKSGRAWWAWAWKTPQAAAWATGVEVVVARRASLEDDLDTLEHVPLDLAELLEVERGDARVKRIEDSIRTLHRLAGGRLNVAREMRELDDRLGLTPKAMAALRWSITAETPVAPPLEVVPDRWRSAATG